jgi:hypothetical protein
MAFRPDPKNCADAPSSGSTAPINNAGKNEGGLIAQGKAARNADSAV